MDAFPVFEFIYKHNAAIVGGLVALILVTSIALLWRILGEREGGADAGASSGASALNVKELESTLQRVLSQTQITATVARPAAAAGAESFESFSGAGGAVPADVQAALAERESRIAELQSQLEQARAQQSAGAAAGGGGADASAATAALDAKVKDLEARLAEYAIIEDDIADLSLFKDENQRLKSEIESLRLAMAKMSAAPPAPAPSAVPAATARTFEKADKFGLDPDDDVMKQFAAAVNGQSAPMPEADLSMGALAGGPELSAKAKEAAVGRQAVSDLEAALDGLGIGLPTPEPMTPDSAEAAPQTPQLGVVPMPKFAPAPADAEAAAAGAQAAIEKMMAEIEPVAPDAEANETKSMVDAMLKAARSEESGGAPAAGGPKSQDDIDAMLAGLGGDPQPPARSPIPEPADAAMDASHDDPLGGDLDTGKMLDEVENLDLSAGDDDALSESLDTDKLLSEVSGLGGGAPFATPGHDDAASFEAPPAPPSFGKEEDAAPSPLSLAQESPIPVPPPSVLAPVEEIEMEPQEDLFGEFVDQERA